MPVVLRAIDTRIPVQCTGTSVFHRPGDGGLGSGRDVPRGYVTTYSRKWLTYYLNYRGGVAVVEVGVGAVFMVVMLV